MMLTDSLSRRRVPFQHNKRGARYALILLLATQLPALAQAATIVVTSTAANRGTFTELQCLPPGSDVDAGPGATTVTGGATLAAAMADGVVTLREAICVANNTPEPDVIVLSRDTYTLTGPDNHWYGPNGLPPIADDITIEGNGALIERTSSSAFRLFFVSRKTLTDGINIVGGADRARLELRDLTLRNGRAQGGNGQAGGGGAGMGGAIFSQGLLHLERVTLVGNIAQGGASGTGGFTSSGGGGGMGASGGATGGGFGPGLFGGALGGSPLYDATVTNIANAACGGGAGFGLAPGGEANYLNVFVVAGDGGGLGNVGGDSNFACSVSRCAGEGRDGGAGGQSLLGDAPTGNGRGGSFGRSGDASSRCAGGGGVGAGGAAAQLESGFQGGSGGFGGGGGSRVTFGTGGPLGAAKGGGGGFGGGGGGGDGSAGSGGAGGFGAGDGGTLVGLPSGGGGAGLGGALFNHGGEATAINTTWSDNRAIGGSVPLQNIARPGAGYGGAIFNLDGILDLRFSTLSGNVIARGDAPNSSLPAPAGGAVYNRAQNPAVYGFTSRVTIEASILADSVDGTGAAISDCNHSVHPEAAAPSSDLFGSNSILFETLATITDFETHSACSPGTGGLLADPQLLPLADNGGLGPTQAIPDASPALNSAASCGGEATDQRGVARPQGAACDIGAFEREVLQCPAGGVLFVDRQAAAGGNGRSWASAFSDLQEALTVVDSCEIWVAAGVYKPSTDPVARSASFVLRNGVAIYGGFAGTETVRDQRDPLTNLSVLSGDIDNNDNADADGVVTNVADIAGANSFNVVFASSTNATGVFDGFTITAGLANGGSARTRQGGGMYLTSGSPVLSQLRFIGNRATLQGGAMHNDSGSPSLERVRFVRNWSDSLGGGFSNLSGSPVLTDVEFSGNRATGGGGMNNERSSPLLSNVGFWGNLAASGDGGGMRNQRGSPVLSNASFSGNRAQGNGGGLFSTGVTNDPANPLLRNAVFWSNQDASGIGTASASISRSGGGMPGLSHSLMQGCNPGGTWSTACGSDGGGNLADADPQFVSTPDPAAAPGAAGDLRLQARSAAIDAGNNSLNATLFDLAGNARVFGGTIDLGAYETPYLGVSLSTDGNGSGSAAVQSPVPARFDPGDVVTVESVPASNSDFAGWSGDLVDSANPLAFVISSDTALTANFTLKTFQVSASASGEGSITPASQSVVIGGTASFSVAPAIGWSLVSVSGEPCSLVNTGGTHWLAENIVADCAVEAVFSIDSYTVTASTASGQGSISPDSQSVDHGSSAGFTLTPETGWSVASVSGDTCKPEDQGGGSWTASNITQDCAVLASFSAVATDLQIAKDSGVDAALDGQVLVYAITVTNAGPADVTGAELTDILPATLVDAEWACLPEVSNTACPPAPFDAGSGNLYAEIDLPVDGFLRYDLSARVQADGGTLVSNTATVTTPAEIDELEPSNNSATDDTLIVPEGIFASGFEAGPKALTVPAAAKAQREATGRCGEHSPPVGHAGWRRECRR